MTGLRLDQLEQARPDPERHWLIDGMVRAGSRTLVLGGPGSGRTLLATELACAVATFTGCLGGPPPRQAGRTIVVTDDPFETAQTARRLLTGRGLVRAAEAVWLPRPADPGQLPLQLCALSAQPAHLVVLDLNVTRGTCGRLAGWFDTAARQGTTVVVLQRQDEDDWTGWRNRHATVSFDSCQQILAVTPDRGPARRALLISTPTTRG